MQNGVADVPIENEPRCLAFTISDAALAVSSARLVLPQQCHVEERGSHISLVQLSESAVDASSILKALGQEGYTIDKHALSQADSIPQDSIVLVVDELFKPVLAEITDAQWTAVQALLKDNRKLVWATRGGHMRVTEPKNAMFAGFSRSVRSENPGLRLMTVDVESSSSPATLAAIKFVLGKMSSEQPKLNQESEFVERDGVLYTSRILVDDASNTAGKQDATGGELVKRPLHGSPQCIRLQCERVGTLESLQYGELAATEIPLLGPEFVEVELYAAGLNFKDVAVTMGIVPENQYLLGLEGAGVVRRVGSAASQFHVGQRVLVHKKGCFANRVQATTDGVYPLPDDMSFEAASTLACVYLVSIYGLYHLANLQRGQTVLIHSAAGGVGIACIQLAQHRGAEVSPERYIGLGGLY